MNRYYFIRMGLTMSLVLAGWLVAVAQEINCTNQLDDDGDGLVDYFDPDCACGDLNYFGSCVPTCQYAIPSSPLVFNTEWSSTDLVPTYCTPLLADINADGTPEVLISGTTNLVTSEPRRASGIRVMNGLTGATLFNITTPSMLWVPPTPMAVADIDNDGFAEIIISTSDATDNNTDPHGFTGTARRRLYCYEHDGTVKWKSNAQYGYTGGALHGSSVGLADFNRDGIAEVYVYNQIFNAQTGILLAQGGTANPKGLMGNYTYGNIANPIAADFLPAAGLELACGNGIYTVNITNTAGTAGNTMTLTTRAGMNDGMTSAADIDLDGQLDIVVASVATPHLVVWNPRTNTIIASLSNTGIAGSMAGIPFIGDMDGDCAPEIGITRANRVFAYEYNGTTTLAQKWALVTTDGSGMTGITMFDFNQDGITEIVYRDETNLRILNGSGASVTTIDTRACTSGTGAEMPIVGDVDGDGQAEICVTCNSASNNRGNVTVFESAGAAWAPTRNVWNQYSYLSVNIEDNLRIPAQQQPHQALFSNSACVGATCSENRPLNSFLVQSTILSKNGCPLYPAPDATVKILSVDNSTCADDGIIDVSFRINNVGDAFIPANTQIAFYLDDPQSAAPPVFNTMLLPSSLAKLDSIDLSTSLVVGNGTFNLHIVVNDDGSVARPYDLSLDFPSTNIAECIFVNNIAMRTAIDCEIILESHPLVFNIAKNTQGVLLDWSAPYYPDLNNWVVERSKDGVLFEKIGERTAIALPTETESHTWQDNNPYNGDNYYRLRMEFNNQNHLYSPIKAINFERISQSIRLYPNPAQNELNIELPEGVESCELQIFNSLGQILRREMLSGMLASISVADLDNGTYILQCVLPNGISINKKIVVQH